MATPNNSPTDVSSPKPKVRRTKAKTNPPSLPLKEELFPSDDDKENHAPDVYPPNPKFGLYEKAR